VAIPRFLARQFALPHGVLGALVGRFMARSNAGLTFALIDRLTLGGGEAVLEIGYGPGAGITRLARRLPSGRVCGIDPSPVMRTQADRHSRAQVGRVDLQIGTAASLPWPPEMFDAVCATNSAQLWDPLEAAAHEIARVLKPSGQLALALHQRAVRPDGTFVDTLFFDRLDHALTAAGFQEVQSEQHSTPGGHATFISAHKPYAMS